MFERQRQCVTLCVGLLLFFAAAMKVFGGSFGAVLRTGVFSLQSIQFSIINMEILLGIWLWSRLFGCLAWLTTVLVFGCFSLVSAYQGLIGQSSCGCLGKLTVHPWLALTVDLLVLGMLILVRPSSASMVGELRSCASFGRKILLMCGAVAVILASLAGYGYYQHGSFESALANLKGELVTIEPFLYDLGTCEDLEEKEITVRIVNHKSEPVRIVGQYRDCLCNIISELPLTILAHDSVDVKLTYQIVSSEGMFTNDVVLFVDTGFLDNLRFRLTGRVRVNPKN